MQPEPKFSVGDIVVRNQITDKDGAFLDARGDEMIPAGTEAKITDRFYDGDNQWCYYVTLLKHENHGFFWQEKFCDPDIDEETLAKQVAAAKKELASLISSIG